MTLGDWITLADGSSLKVIYKTPTWLFTSGNRHLTDKQVALQSFFRDARKLHAAAIWLLNSVIDIRYRSRWLGSSYPYSSSPGSNLRQDVSMFCLITNINTTTGATWTAAPRAVTRAPTPAIETIMTAAIKQVAIPTSVPAQSVKSLALLKPVLMYSKLQPDMPTCTITKSTTVVSISFSS